jgi:hypothetical protein
MASPMTADMIVSRRNVVIAPATLAKPVPSLRGETNMSAMPWLYTTTTTPTGATISIDNPPTATTSMMSEGIATVLTVRRICSPVSAQLPTAT